MRKKHHVLMEGTKPEGGEWNYDKSNRKKWKKETLIPPYKIFLKDVSELVNEIKIAEIQTIGNINKKFRISYNKKRST
jgi:deoxyribodipyrimidine photolyase-related protein